MNDTLTVIRKGGKRLQVESNARLKAALVEHISKRGPGYLFCNPRTGKPILDVKTAFQSAIRRSGIGHCRFHDLRHHVCHTPESNDVIVICNLASPSGRLSQLGQAGGLSYGRGIAS